MREDGGGEVHDEDEDAEDDEVEEEEVEEEN